MQTPCALASGIRGIHTGLSMAQTATHNIASIAGENGTGNGSTIDLSEELIHSLLAEQQIAASSKSIAATDKMIGNIISTIA